MRKLTTHTKKILGGFIVLFLLSACTVKNINEGYLFSYFIGDGPGEEQIHYAVSQDGYHFKALNGDQPIIDSEDISVSGGVRDPHIIRTEDGKSFYMVATDLNVSKMGWSNTAIVMMKSEDLINWKSEVVDIPQVYSQSFAQVRRVWAPETIYDHTAGKYMVYFSMLEPNSYDKIYYVYVNKDFTGFESAPKQLFFSPTENACIDANIIKKEDQFYMFFKSEDGKPGIKLAISDKLTEGYVQQGSQRVDKEIDSVEGSCVFKCIDSQEWIMMYDVYTKGTYQFTKSSDMKNFTVIDDEVSMNFKPRHGSVLAITKREMRNLIKEFGTLDESMIKPLNDRVKKYNLDIDVPNKKIYLPLKNGADLTHFSPNFKSCSGLDVKPSSPQDFSNGDVGYTFSNNEGLREQFMVEAHVDNNPVLEGYYADPEVLYSKKDKRFYIYPTSDGLQDWSGDFFNVFSSDNLVNWEMEDVTIDLGKDVSWANRDAWSPCIEEKLIGENYKYFYYFS
nr:family 43 glycosylhydrolase [Bacteroidales bacterium]